METLVTNGGGAQFNGFKTTRPFSTTFVSEALSRSQLRIKSRRRKISLHAGRGIELLAHAIEYLSDEFALDSMSTDARGAQGEAIWRSRIEAVDLLKRLNREVYLNCPIVLTFSERLDAVLRRRHA